MEAKDFLQKHCMGYETVVPEDEIDRYIDEMKKGLCGQPSSLLMLPSYIALKDDVQREKPVLCVDAGGTNLRITVAQFDADGKFSTGEVFRYIMPGVEKELSAQAFFDALAELIFPLTNITTDIVISFAYRAKTLPNIDSEIVDITKEVKVKGAGGKLLGKEIYASLAKLGASGCSVIVLNDSVATALAGKAEKLTEGYGSFTGTILGTGSNSCYMETIGNIKKMNGHQPDGVTVVNAEAGSYDKLPRCDIDIAFDNSLQNPGVGVFEKMTSGGYLGNLCGFTLRVASAEGVFEQPFVSQLDTMQVNEFLTDRTGVVADHFTGEKDREAAYEILLNLTKRAGRLLALQMAAMALKACKTNPRVCMTIEGTTYEKMFGLKHEALSTLLPFLQSRGIEADVISVDMAVLKGCAIAGLSR